MAYGHRVFEDLVEVVGELAAERLSIDCGGMVFYLGMRVDKRPDQLPELVTCLGVDLAKTLINRYPSPSLEIPIYGKIRARNRMIRRLAVNHSLPFLARKFGLSVRMVRSIVVQT